MTLMTVFEVAPQCRKTVGNFEGHPFEGHNSLLNIGAVVVCGQKLRSKTSFLQLDSR